MEYYKYKYTEGKDKYFVYSTETKPIKTSYIDTNDLVECLDLYYSNELDNVDKYLDRIYLPEWQLHPTNSLYGQLDSTILKQAIESLPGELQYTLKLIYGSPIESEDIIPDITNLILELAERVKALL